LRQKLAGLSQDIETRVSKGGRVAFGALIDDRTQSLLSAHGIDSSVDRCAGPAKRAANFGGAVVRAARLIFLAFSGLQFLLPRHDPQTDLMHSVSKAFGLLPYKAEAASACTCEGFHRVPDLANAARAQRKCSIMSRGPKEPPRECGKANMFKKIPCNRGGIAMITVVLK
jgi:hypothetical protein